MDAIYIESACSHAGPGFDDFQIMTKFLNNISIDPNGVTITNKYSLVTRRAFTKLTGYVYKLATELQAKKGCLSNGETTVKALMACVEQINEINNTGNFYIINANSAHHFSFVLSKCAFQSQIDADQKAAMGRKKVVVNIDNHVDYGLYKRDTPGRNTNIHCGGWGGYHLGYWAVHCAGGAEYVSLSNGEIPRAGEKHCVQKIRGGGANVVKSYLANESAVLRHLKEYKTGEHDVYFTVDRDFMLENGTKYGDAGCQYNNTDGMVFVKKCIDAIKTNCTILSADIIGMPTKGDLAGHKMERPPTQFNLAVNDVKNVFKWVSA